jgi:hypothetical protein
MIRPLPVTARAYPRVVLCRHCGVAVLRDNDGDWIHATLSYVCRDRWGGVRPTTATPPSRAWRSEGRE